MSRDTANNASEPQGLGAIDIVVDDDIGNDGGGEYYSFCSF